MIPSRLPVADPRHRIEPDFLGWLETPGPLTHVGRSAVVSGWTFSRTEPIDELIARIGPRDYPLTHGLARPDVAIAYPGDERAANSGFSGFIAFEPAPSSGSPLEVWAHTASGRRQRLFGRKPVPIFVQALAWSAIGAFRKMRSRMRAPKARTADATRAHSRARAAELGSFLGSGARLPVPAATEPVVSVIVVLWNRAELTYGCLRALRQARVPMELVLVDNGSTDLTSELLSRVDGATVIRNDTNVGFTIGANQGAASARGNGLLFVNSDAEVLPDCVDRLVKCLESSSGIGAVGGKLVWPGGGLQEAGSIIWSDGGCEGYGRGNDPTSPEYMFQREVDFCSAALLLTPRDVFLALGGFDERYKPAYYEDADYCVRVWKSGRRVVFEPRAVAIHSEFGSTRSFAEVERLQRERRTTFVELHRDWLASQSPPGIDRLRARRHPQDKLAILYIEDILPDRSRGAGFPRSAALLEAVTDLGYGVTVFPMTSGGGTASLHPTFATVETMSGLGQKQLCAFLASRRGYYAAIIVSRPHNLRFLKAAVGRDFGTAGPPTIYDAEAIFAVREVARDRVLGKQVGRDEEARLIRREVDLAAGCAAIVTVNESERARFLAAGHSKVVTLGHSLTPRPTTTPFALRDSVLFVGGFSGNGPNEDAVEFLLKSIQPAIEERLPDGARVVVAGSGLDSFARQFGGGPADFICDPVDLEPLYSAARVFVAPTRFAAGIPLKILEAASRGIPAVCTPLLASQLGWTTGRELLTASTPEEFAGQIARLFEDEDLWTQIRDAAINRMTVDCDPRRFREDVRCVLSLAGVAAP